MGEEVATGDLHALLDTDPAEGLRQVARVALNGMEFEQAVAALWEVIALYTPPDMHELDESCPDCDIVRTAVDAARAYLGGMT